MKSNQESGNGFSDLILKRKNDRSAIVMEFKKVKEDSFVAQDKACEEALEQIRRNRYDHELKLSGCVRILKYGIAFCGKSCTVKLADD